MSHFSMMTDFEVKVCFMFSKSFLSCESSLSSGWSKTSSSEMPEDSSSSSVMTRSLEGCSAWPSGSSSNSGFGLFFFVR